MKVLIALIALAGFFYLFRRSIDSVRAEPYVVQRQHTVPWTLATASATSLTSPILVARPPEDFGSRLFDQIFERAMESMRRKSGAGVPLVLRGEYERSLAGRYTPDALLEMARAAGLDRTAFTPVCVSVKRVSEPGRTRQLYYAIFDSPAFVEFRARLGREAGPSNPSFDPVALSPILIVGGTEPDFDQWLPIAASADRDCVAPIAVK